MDWQQVQQLFGDAGDLPSEAQAAFLDRHCEQDDVRREVERLLGLVSDVGAFLESPVLQLPTEIGYIGLEIGPYRLDALLGEGGMGTVYRASRIDAAYDRDVAIKLMHYPSGALVERFEAERKMLAALEHPHIARLYDGGTTEEGSPYLVMELVEGERIDAYCAERTLDERLECFRQVCDAVSYAHRNLLVHRDLKPSNILVTGDGTVKLLDFGIAKSLLDAEVTVTDQRAMTPAYASPEQIRGEAVTTASDVYALGVLLFRLLTDEAPYRLPDEASGFEIQQAVLDQEPVRPSRMATKQIGGDLDSIVLKALRKEPAQRYGSVDALLDDIDRYRQSMPVVARGGAWRYRAGKFVRRHRWALGSAAVVTAILVAGAIALVQQTRRALREGQTAQVALASMDDALMAFDPEQSRGEEVSARDVLNAMASRVQTAATDPTVRIRLLTTLGSVLTRLGEFDDAESLLTEAHALRLETNRDVGLGFYHLGELEWSRRNYQEAEGYYREALAMIPEETIDHARALRGLGLALGQLGEQNAESHLNNALFLLRQHFANSDPEILAVQFGLGLAARDSGDFERAEKLFGQLIALHMPKGPGPALGRSLAELGIVKYRQNDLKEARRSLERALPMLRVSMGSENTYVAEVLGKYGVVLEKLNFPNEAEEALREAISYLPPEHPGIAAAFHNIARIQNSSGKHEKARVSAERALRMQRSIFGESHINVPLALCQLGNISVSLGNRQDAEYYYRECARIASEHHPNNRRLALMSEDGLHRADRITVSPDQN